MTKLTVTNEAGVDINGAHYDLGHEFEFDAVPEHVQSAVDAGDVAEVHEAPEESPKVEDAGSDSSSENEPADASEAPAEDDQAASSSEGQVEIQGETASSAG